ncbi:MAG: cytochrome c [Lewinella sp.]|nr:cytochrome c [Lewinella sp.]
MKDIKLLLLAIVAIMVINACSPPDGNFPGSEYMPDMGHSIAVEANIYDNYYYNTWDEESTIPLRDLVRDPGKPVAGTVPRGYAGVQYHGMEAMDVVLGNDGPDAIRITPNGYVPYYYPDSDSARLVATAEIIDNPYPITATGLAHGKELYTIYCGICHGDKANGLGYLYDSEENSNAKYLAAPANLVSEEFSAASNGRFYHAIMYGKNVMGSYADKLSYEERWQVIHYIRGLQAKENGFAYNEDENTFNASFGTPAASLDQLAQDMEGEMHEAHDGEEMPAVEGEHSSDH